MAHIKKLLVIAVALLAFSPALASAAFYVSPSGSDTNPGTISAPFKTLSKAKTAMESSSDKTAILRGGTYLLTANFTLSSADSNQTWQPYQNETPVIDGQGLYSIISTSANNLTIQGITFQNLADALVGGWVHGGLIIIYSQSPTIKWNTFRNCKLGTRIGGGGSVCLTIHSTTNGIIDSNTFDGMNLGYSDTFDVLSSTWMAQDGLQWVPAAIGVGGDTWTDHDNNTITHNLIQNGQGGGITFSGSNNIVDRNIIKHTGTNVFDAGAIYAYDPTRVGTNNIITNNIITDFGGEEYLQNWSAAIYFDCGVSNVTVTGNIVSGRAGSFFIQTNGGTNDKVSNNIFDFSSSPGTGAWVYTSMCAPSSMTGNTFQRNILYSGGAFPSTFWGMYNYTGQGLPTNSTNLYYSANNSSIPNTGVVDTNRVLANPLFSNASAGNYSMPSNSPAYSQLAWQTIPTDQGPLPNPYVSTTAAPTVTFVATPASISVGQTSVLSWSSTGATSCSGIGTATTGSASVAPTVTTTYSITCTGSGGSTTKTATVTVSSTSGAVTTNLASPSTLSTTPGSSITYTSNWSGGPTATSYQVFTHFVDASGVNVFTDTDHYPSTLTTSWSTTYSETRTVTVPSTLPAGTYKVMIGLFDAATRLPLSMGTGVSTDGDSRYQIAILTAVSIAVPTASLTASPTSITAGQSSTLSWTSTNATSCSGVDFSTSGLTQGSVDVFPTVNKTYSINCGGATALASVTVTSITPSGIFQIGSRVKTTDNLRVRNKATTREKGVKILCVQPIGSLGTISGGPKLADGYTWWQVNYDSLCDGWSIQDYLTTSLSAPITSTGPVGEATTISITHTLAKGWTGPEVSLLQSLLQRLGLFGEEITGYFGSVTEQSVVQLQQQNGLSAVGIVGPKTRELLNSQPH